MVISTASVAPLPEQYSPQTYTAAEPKLGLHVLVVDDDPISLLIMDRMLQQCSYKVTTCGNKSEALEILRAKKGEFDVVISEVHMGFKLLELVSLEMEVPVILLSNDGEIGSIMKGIKLGACDCLLKPVRIEELRHIWKHVVRRTMGAPGMDKEARWLAEDKHLDESSMECNGLLVEKERHVVWTVAMHQGFVNAVEQLGIGADPKRILQLIKAHNLTAEDVARHLEKYKKYLAACGKTAPKARCRSFHISTFCARLSNCWSCFSGQYA